MLLLLPTFFAIAAAALRRTAIEKSLALSPFVSAQHKEEVEDAVN